MLRASLMQDRVENGDTVDHIAVRLLGHMGHSKAAGPTSCRPGHVSNIAHGDMAVAEAASAAVASSVPVTLITGAPGRPPLLAKLIRGLSAAAPPA